MPIQFGRSCWDTTQQAKLLQCFSPKNYLNYVIPISQKLAPIPHTDPLSDPQTIMKWSRLWAMYLSLNIWLPVFDCQSHKIYLSEFSIHFIAHATSLVECLHKPNRNNSKKHTQKHHDFVYVFCCWWCHYFLSLTAVLLALVSRSWKHWFLLNRIVLHESAGLIMPFIGTQGEQHICFKANCNIQQFVSSLELWQLAC